MDLAVPNAMSDCDRAERSLGMVKIQPYAHENDHSFANQVDRKTQIATPLPGAGALTYQQRSVPQWPAVSVGNC
jgi:hypothetical protein